MGGAPLKPVVVLGATGSIGRQTIEVAERLERPVVGLAAGHVSEALIELAAALPDAAVAVADPKASQDVPPALTGRIAFGPDAVDELARLPGATIVNGIVGSAGLPPTLAALTAGNEVALANKESLVAGGPLVAAALERGGSLIPVDSEHSAIWQCLAGEDPATVARLIVTASGGPFRGRAAAELETVTPTDALAHPTWQMGPRITIDSATLMNKAFEVIEAHWLFAIPYERIDVVVHPQSFVHSLVEFVDGTVKAEVGPPDMRKPIQYALTHPRRRPAPHPPLDLVGRMLTFEVPDRAVFPCLELGYEAGRRGGVATAVLNAADEVAVEAFLDGAIGFRAIARVIERTLDGFPDRVPVSLEDVLDADRQARERARQAVAREASRR